MIVTAPGRVQTWLNNKTSCAPISCTLFVVNNHNIPHSIEFATLALKGGAGVKIVLNLDQLPPKLPISYTLNGHILTVGDGGETITVQDSLSGLWGIIHAWQYLFTGESITLDWSNLRPAGTVGSNGIIASGPDSFILVATTILDFLMAPSVKGLLQIYGTINDVMRRGGFKRGIITSSMRSSNPLFEEYVDAPITEIRGSHKKAFILDTHIDYIPAPLEQKILYSLNEESSFLEKPLPNNLYLNVCEGIILPHRGTCLIHRINLGQCINYQDIVFAFGQATREIVSWFLEWRKYAPNASIFANIDQDRQVAIDVMGLANTLAIKGISYREFVHALEWVFSDIPWDNNIHQDALKLIDGLCDGYRHSVEVADKMMAEAGLPPLDRLHCVEPAQNHAYQTTDLLGNTTCRGIWAPLGRRVARVSDTQKRKLYYHGNVETASEVGPQLHQRLCELWQTMMLACGRPHAVSFDSWEPITHDWIVRWERSPLLSKYYSDHKSVNQQFLQKEVPTCGLRPDECESCAG